ncbi:Pkinase-domain-containing protein [Pisolithus marmoratus]|nr:Pkinase-domain-containing protein [Pisolithus marmoratus]
MVAHGHKHTHSVTQNHKAQLANAYNELGKELSSQRIRIMGNYTLGKVIGEGAYGKVRIGTHRLTSTRVAIKQIPKAMSASLTREIHHHRQLHHPHVTQMYEVIATESYIWIVTELCCGGELFDYLAEKGRLSEDEARIIFGQLCLAVAYLHDKGIVHRDLKLENVLLDERCRVKLGDFGFTREYDRGVYMETFCGTTGYAAPEMLQGKRYLGPEVDVWSMGVILYCLLTGTLPFDDDDEAIMREKVIRGEYEDPQWLQQMSRDLIRNILQIDPSKRLTIPQILSSPWFTAKDEAASKEEPLPDNGLPSASSTTSVTTDGTFVSASSNILPPDPFLSNDEVQMHPNLSQSTITKTDRSTRNGSTWQPVTPIEEEDSAPTARVPPHPTRTPARTKRRSFDSPVPLYPPQDFASLLKTPTPIIFSTPAERELLNALSALDACDAAGAIWWMLMRKHEKRIVDEVRASSAEGPAHRSSRKDEEYHTSSRRRMKSSVAVQTDESERLAPEFAVVPPTPTVDASPFLSPSPTTAESSGRGSTRGAEGKDKDPLKLKRDGKVRSGSISIMQRLVRKKSADGVREEKEKTKDHEKKIGGSAKVREGPAVPAPQTLESSAIPGSPWVVAGDQTPTPAASKDDTLTSLPNFNEDGSRVAGGHRNRANRKGKRKEPTQLPQNTHLVAKTPKVAVKRRTSDSGRGRRVKRASLSSRRSINSAQVFQIPSKGDPSSRPSSIQSFSQTGKHHKSPSAGSNGSASYYRTSSPLPKYQHRRHGSSSSTRVVRQIPSTPVSSSRPQHNLHSLTSSRPASFYEVNYPSRNSDENTPRRGAGTPHGSSSIGRTSWKKSWGNEPPGWQSRSTHLPVEVLVISPPPDIRDDEDVPEFAGGLGQMSGGSSSSKTNVFLSSEKPTPLILSPPRNHHSRGRTAKTRTSGGGQSPVGRVSPALPQVELAYEPPETRGGRWQLPGVRGPTFRQAIQEEDEGEEE